ncbi:PH (Pleckstrin Homology) domain-containing protein [Christiangramia gaetbulicola]|uniref:PH (Pleckstrin Homology) domain-containing protein n=1 Tax=Christiangramia gaetbulicola TaxID=703340 RepID=A0A2T6AIP4_9FLAO|nr:PH domain-containing protein [Christiangramia gaetbulicola]PTX43679.1 PH (Pleckstrin Homology) domain-containing protein [Christiangramia gaetbulicola]
MSILSSLLGNAGAKEKEKLQEKYGKLLIPSEEIAAGFKIIRDTFIFTNKRLILVDVQGITGSKIEYFSVLYKSITRFSVETAGSFDLDAELKIWISGEQTPSISKRFNKKVDIYEVQKLLAEYTL